MAVAPRVLAVIASGALLLGGCGGAIKDEELRRGVESLASQAAEGSLLARGAAQDRTKATFTRVQSRDLSEEAAHEAEKLQDAEATGDVADAKASAVTLAQDVAGALGELQVAPGDERLAERLERRLDRLNSEASRLAGEL